MRIMTATEFKAKCLAVLDDVNRTQVPITILKHGKPVAQVVPPLSAADTYPQSSLLGSVRIVGDIISPVLDAGAWDAETGRS